MENKLKEEIRTYLETGEDTGVRDRLKHWFIRNPTDRMSEPERAEQELVERELQVFWDESLQTAQLEPGQVDTAFAALKERMSNLAPIPAAAVQPRFRRIWVRRCMQAAAVLALVAGSWYVSETVVLRKTAGRYVTVAAPLGQRLNITLQDGTKVCLNSGTELEYPILFDGDRRVKLSGEALFDVERDPEHPFIVETFACDVEVLGTRFNVIADEATRNFSTALLRGRLKVTDTRNPAEQILMNPNDLVYLNDGRLALKSIDDPDDYLWAEGFINIRGSSFAELMKKLEKTYGAEIIIERTTNPTLEVVRGKVPTSMGLDYALRTLQDLVPFEYVRDNDTNIIRIK